MENPIPNTQASDSTYTDVTWNLENPHPTDICHGLESNVLPEVGEPHGLPDCHKNIYTIPLDNRQSQSPSTNTTSGQSPSTHTTNSQSPSTHTTSGQPLSSATTNGHALSLAATNGQNLSITV